MQGIKKEWSNIVGSLRFSFPLNENSTQTRNRVESAKAMDVMESPEVQGGSVETTFRFTLEIFMASIYCCLRGI